MHQRRTRPETMPAHTHKHGEPKTNTQIDKCRLTTQHWVFRPRVLLPPGTRFILLNGIHCSPDSESGEELSFPQSRQPSSALAGLSLAPAGMDHSPFYRKLSSVPDTFLLPSRTLDLHWTFLSCLSTGAISILPLCPGSVLLPQ